MSGGVFLTEDNLPGLLGCTDALRGQFNTHDVTPARSGALIGVIGSGVDARHPCLSGRVHAERSFTPSAPRDMLGHGTGVAVAALEMRGEAMIVSAKVSDERHQISVAAVIAALNWMIADLGLREVTLSVSFPLHSEAAKALCAAIQKLAKTHAFRLSSAVDPCARSHDAALPGAAARTRHQQSTVSDLLGQTNRETYLRELAVVAIEECQHDAAIMTLRELETLAPEDGGVAFTLAALLLQEGRLAEASFLADKAARLTPGTPAQPYLQAMVAGHRGDASEMAKALNAVLAIDAEYKDARRLLNKLRASPADPVALLRDHMAERARSR